MIITTNRAPCRLQTSLVCIDPRPRIAGQHPSRNPEPAIAGANQATVHLTFIPKLTKVYLPDNDLFVCALTACVRSSGSFRLLHMPDNGLCRTVPNTSMPSYLFLTGPGSRLQYVNNARARGLRDLGKDNSGLQFHIHIMIPQRNVSSVRSQRGMKESAFSESFKT